MSTHYNLGHAEMYRKRCLLYHLLLLVKLFRSHSNVRDVYIFHVIDNSLWGEVDGSALQGIFPCMIEPNTTQTGVTINFGKCELVSSVLPIAVKTAKLKESIDFAEIAATNLQIYNKKFYVDHLITTVSLYNIHTWGTLSKWPHKPDKLRLNTTFTIAESEESSTRFSKLFQTSFPFFDASSTTSPFSTIQRTYFSGLNASDFLPMKPFHSLIKGASFVASTCHRGGGVCLSEPNFLSLYQLKLYNFFFG